MIICLIYFVLIADVRLLAYYVIDYKTLQAVFKGKNLDKNSLINKIMVYNLLKVPEKSKVEESLNRTKYKIITFMTGDLGDREKWESSLTDYLR